jgi:predicted TPR repeat methyltransferase
MAPDAQSLDATLDRVAMLDTAISLSATCERAWFYRGMLLKRAQREDAAYRDFKRVTELNPRNVDAARELRIFEMRKGKAPPAPESTSGKGEGLFGRLFKKR